MTVSDEASSEEVCSECELAILDDVDPADVCGDCRTADLVWSEVHVGSGRRVTRVSIGETVDGEQQSVVVDQRWETEAEPDRVGLPAPRLDTIRDMLVEGADRHEFEDQFGADDPIDGVTTVEVDEAAGVYQKLEPERVGDDVTLTRTMVAAIRAELKTNRGSE